MPASKLSRYPAAYSKILLSLPIDGTPIEIQLHSNDAALAERIRFYNYLKFLRRNPAEAIHFGNRHNDIVISVKENFIRFQLGLRPVNVELEAGFMEALAHMNLPASNLPVTSLAAVPLTATAPTLPAEPAIEPELNLLDTLLNAVNSSPNQGDSK